MEQKANKKKQEEPGPELPTDESQNPVNYIENSDLTDFVEDEKGDLENIFSHIKISMGSDDWRQQYDTINKLRVFNKFHG